MNRDHNHSIRRQSGFSLVEISVVLFLTIVTAALASPSIMQAVYTARLRSAAADLSALMQQARSTAAKSNQNYGVLFTTVGSARIAYLDLTGNNSAYASADPQVEFSGSVFPAAAAPTGSGGQPPAYVLAGDSSSGSVYTNTTTLGFSPRGLPCDYSAPPTCTTPATNYFVYYLTDTRAAPGWSAVVVTKAGRSKVVVWDGTSWH